MTITEDIFRAYDIRGVVENALTPDAVQQIGQAFATEALSQNQKTVVIARDGRLSSPELAQRLSEGLRAGGCDVIDIGMVPTPVLYYATHKLKTGTGIMVTGSHNPPQYNGLKMLIAGNTLYGDSIKALYQMIVEARVNNGEGSYTKKNIVPEYPDMAKRAGIEGTVTLKVLVNKTGVVDSVEVIDGPSVFRESAVEAGKATKFTPAKFNDRPVACWVIMPFKFQLDN